MVGTPRGRDRRARCADAAAQGRHRPPARAHARASSPAASSSAARWRARSCASRGCSCSTSRCPTSTPSCASRRALELQQAAALARRHHGLRHARPGRGDDARRPHGGVHGRPHRAGRHAARDLRAGRRRSTVAGFIGTPPMNLLPATLARRHASASPARRLPVAVARRTPRDVDARRAAGRPAHRAAAASPARVERIEDLGDSAHRQPQRRRPALQAQEPTALPAVREGDDRAPRASRRERAHLFDRASGARLN